MNEIPIKKIWITWEKHRRTTELASSIKGLKLFQLESNTLPCPALKLGRILSYPILLCRTFRIIFHERPVVLIVQNPSMILTLFMVTIGKLFISKLIVDAHNGGVRPFYSKYNWLMSVYCFIHRRSDLTIVTNAQLSDIIHKNGGRTFILEDKLPRLNKAGNITLKGKSNLVLICTFGQDEPFQEVLEAANLLDSSICIYITGRHKNAQQDIIKQASTNVIFTGFLPEDKYVSLLNSCDIIIDLTLAPSCLVCGAYEAVAIGKPLILSDAPALRDYFCKGVVYTENTAVAIAQAVHYAINNKEKLKKEIKQLKKDLAADWNNKMAKFLHTIELIAE